MDNPYKPPATDPGRPGPRSQRPVRLILASWVLVVLMFGWAVVVLVVTPTFEQVFEAFGGTLPRLTTLFVGAPWFWGLPVLASVGLAGFVSSRSAPHRRLTLLVVASWVLAMALIGAGVVALYLPILSLGAVV